MLNTVHIVTYSRLIEKGREGCQFSQGAQGGPLCRWHLSWYVCAQQAVTGRPGRRVFWVEGTTRAKKHDWVFKGSTWCWSPILGHINYSHAFKSHLLDESEYHVSVRDLGSLIQTHVHITNRLTEISPWLPGGIWDLTDQKWNPSPSNRDVFFYCFRHHSGCYRPWLSGFREVTPFPSILVSKPLTHFSHILSLTQWNPSAALHPSLSTPAQHITLLSERPQHPPLLLPLVGLARVCRSSDNELFHIEIGPSHLSIFHAFSFSSFFLSSFSGLGQFIIFWFFEYSSLIPSWRFSFCCLLGKRIFKFTLTLGNSCSSFPFQLKCHFASESNCDPIQNLMCPHLAINFLNSSLFFSF